MLERWVGAIITVPDYFLIIFSCSCGWLWSFVQALPDAREYQCWGECNSLYWVLFSLGTPVSSPMFGLNSTLAPASFKFPLNPINSISFDSISFYNGTWLAPVVGNKLSLKPSSHKVPCSISSSAKVWIFVWPSFLPKLIQLSIHTRFVNEYQHLLGANLWCTFI